MDSTLVDPAWASRRLTLVALAAVGAITCWATPALAATVDDVIIDSVSMTLEEGEAGPHPGRSS